MFFYKSCVWIHANQSTMIKLIWFCVDLETGIEFTESGFWPPAQFDFPAKILIIYWYSLRKWIVEITCIILIYISLRFGSKLSKSNLPCSLDSNFVLVDSFRFNWCIVLDYRCNKLRFELRIFKFGERIVKVTFSGDLSSIFDGFLIPTLIWLTSVELCFWIVMG